MSAAPRLTSSMEPNFKISFLCPFSRHLIRDDAVIDRQGHCYTRAKIEEWLQTNSSTPFSHKTASSADLKNHLVLKQQIAGFQVLSIDDGEEIDSSYIPKPTGIQEDSMAKTFLTSAKELESKNQLLDAEGLYIRALEYTCKSEDYMHLPQIFEKKKEAKRAAYAYWYLAFLQIKEGKQTDALASVQQSLRLISSPKLKYSIAQFLKELDLKKEASKLLLEVAIQACYHKAQEALSLCQQALDTFRGDAEIWKMLACLQPDTANKILLDGAKERTLSLKERKVLCQWVLLKEPDHAQANFQLLNLKVERLQDKNRQLAQQLNEERAERTLAIARALESEKIDRLVGALWSPQEFLRTQATLELANIGAPALPKVILGLKSKAGLSDYHFEGVGAALNVLKKMVENQKDLPELKAQLRLLIQEIKGGLKLAGLSNTDLVIKKLAIELGILQKEPEKKGRKL